MGERRTGLHALVGAYVLDAVEDGDRAQFERHLLSCDQCRDDVRGLREATARLAAAAAIAPRPELRQSTMQAAAVTRQLPPVVIGERDLMIGATAIAKGDRKSTRLNSSHWITSRMPSSA